VDFAYRVHTEVGHRCRGAIVEGQFRELNAPLRTGERVEVLTGDHPAPNRDWLDMHLGYVRSGRAREKIHDWFRAKGSAANAHDGRKRLVGLLARLGMAEPSAVRWSEAARTLGFADPEALCCAVGAGECQTIDAIDALHPQAEFELQLELIPDLGGPDRRVCRIEIRAKDRDGLLRDVTALLSRHGVSLLGNSGRVDSVSGEALLVLEVRLATLRELVVLVDRLGHIQGVLDARVDRR
jgi:(p)ppGpp synthase/HD superfamily hydrolase